MTYLRKLIIGLMIVALIGCSSIKQARQEFNNEITGFKKEWARVILKKEIEEQ